MSDFDKSFSKNSSSGVTIFIIGIIALLVVYTIISFQPVALDKEGAVSIDGLFGQSFSSNTPVVANSVVAYFCHEEKCSSELIKRIDSSTSSIYLAIYSFADASIADALLRAKDRGVSIQVVFDYDQSKQDYSVDEKLLDYGISIKRMDGAGYMHNKFMVIDGNIVSTGSFNYSVNADTKNNENLIFINSSELAKDYKSEFDYLWEKSTK